MVLANLFAFVVTSVFFIYFAIRLYIFLLWKEKSLPDKRPTSSRLSILISSRASSVIDEGIHKV